MNLSVGAKLSARQRRDQHRLRAARARVVDVAGHELAIRRVGVGFALGALAGTVVVTELDEDVIGALPKRVRPAAFVDVAPGAAPAAGEVDQLDVVAEPLLESEAPAAFVGDG